MTIYEIFKTIIEILKIIVWPITIIAIILLFKKSIKELLERLANFEGTFGSINFKVQTKEAIEKTLEQAFVLEKEGKTEDAKKLIDENTDLISKALGLSNNDIKYLINIKDGKDVNRWGKIHLVNAGLIELDGSKLTNAGNIIVNRFLKYNKL